MLPAASSPSISCDFIPIDLTLSLLLPFLLLSGYISYISSQVTHKSLLITLHHCFILMACVIVFHFVCGFSLSMGRETSLGGFVANFTESIFLAEWNDCDAHSNRSLLLNNFIEASKASFAVLLVFGSIMGRLKYLHVFLMILCWYFVTYLPLMLWLQNPSGWLRRIFHVQDYGLAFNIHGMAGVSALLFILSFPPISRVRIKPNNVSRMIFGAWMTFVGLIALAMSSHDSDFRSLMLSAVNTTLSGVTAGIMFYFLFYATKKRPSLLMFGRGLITGAVSCAAFSGDTLVLYAVPIASFISVVSYICFTAMKRFPRLYDATDVVAVHGVPGCLSMIFMGFMKEIPKLTSVDDGEIFDGFFQVLAFLIGLVWCVLSTMCVALLFRFFIQSAAPAQYVERGMDYLYTYEKKEINPMDEAESGTESQYETYTETAYVSNLDINSPQFQVGGGMEEHDQGMRGYGAMDDESLDALSNDGV